MKYIVNIDALIDCLDCLSSVKINGEPYINKELLIDFINKFPKESK